MACPISVQPFVEARCRPRLSQTMTHFLDGLEVVPQGVSPYRLSIVACSISDWHFFRVEGSCRTLMVPSPSRRGQGSDHALLILPLHGQCHSMSSESLFPRVGQMRLSQWGSLSGVTSNDAFSYLSIFVPRRELEASGGNAVPYGHSIETDKGAGAVLRQTWGSLFSQLLSTHDRGELAPLLPGFKELMLSSFASARATGRPARWTSRRLERLMACIEDSLDDPQLSPAVLAVACGMSERQVYREFATAGLRFNAYVREQRLKKAEMFLAAHPNLSIARVAHRCGFTDSTVFGRVFRNTYSMTPTQYRQLEHAPASSSR